MGTKKKVTGKGPKAKNRSTKYDERGVSAGKQEVHAAVKQLGAGAVPFSFCKMSADTIGDPDYVSCLKADGSGSKTLIAYLIWKETKKLRVWRGTAVDAIAMNLNDMICSGVPGPYNMTMIINRNKHLITGEVINEIIAGAVEMIMILKKYGIVINYESGETADLGDQVRTVTVDVVMSGRMPKKDVITTNKIVPGNVIVSLASDGGSDWEVGPNSGLASNGWTNYRHGLLSPYYKEKYPEAYAPETPRNLVYCGEYRLTDYISAYASSLGSVLGFSPTRIFAPLINGLLNSLNETERKMITGIIHNSGGGQTKILGHVLPGLKIVKDSLYKKRSVPPIMAIYQTMSKSTDKEMLSMSNMGWLMEIYCEPGIAKKIVRFSKKMGVSAQITGRVDTWKGKSKNALFITTRKGKVIKYYNK